MPRTAKLPDGTTLQFPDDATLDEMTAEVNRRAGVTPSLPAPSVATMARRHLRSIARGTDVPAGALEPDANPSVLVETARTPAAMFSRKLGTDALRGVAKGATSTAINLGQLVRSITPGVRNLDVSDITRELEPTSTTETITKGAEQVGEFLLPGASEAGAFGPVAAGLSKLPKLARSAILSGATGAGVSEAQGGDPLWGAAGGVGGELISAGAAKAAPKLINLFLGGKALSRTGADAGKGIVEGGIAATHLGDLGDLSRDAQQLAAMRGRVPRALGSLLEKTLRVRNEIGRRIGMAVLAAPQRAIDAEPLFTKPIDDAISAVGTVKSPADLEAMRERLYDKFASLGASKASTAGAAAGGSPIGASVNAATPQQLWQVRDAIDHVINWERASGGADTSLIRVARRVRDNLADALGDAVPELRGVNRQYANLSRAVDRIVDRVSSSSNSAIRQYGARVLGNPLNWAFGYGTWHVRNDPEKIAGLLAARAALGSAPVATGAAQMLRGMGSELGGRALAAVGSRLGSLAGESSSPSPQTQDGRLER